MNGLRVLLVDNDTEQLSRTAGLLNDVQHLVMPANGLDEASEALCIQKFDVVLVGSALANDLSAFAMAVQTLDKNHRPASKTPILVMPTGKDERQNEVDESVDAYLPAHFELSCLAEAVNEVHRSQAAAKQDQSAVIHDKLAVLDVEEFKAQVFYDDPLLIEIIDLFLAERVGQTAEMFEAFAAQDLPKLSRVAHTIKGSLASLHADRARERAQQLETAAGGGNSGPCGQLLQQFEQDLDELEPELLALRREAAAS